MTRDKKRNKRTKLHIIYEILNSLKERRTKTTIAAATDINNKRLENYLEFLIKINAIETDGKFFYRTNKGFEIFEILRDYIKGEKLMQNAKEKLETLLSEKRE